MVERELTYVRLLHLEAKRAKAVFVNRIVKIFVCCSSYSLQAKNITIALA